MSTDSPRKSSETAADETDRTGASAVSGSDPDGAASSGSNSRLDRLQQWLTTYTIHFKTALAAGSLVLGLVALPILAFGTLAALPTGGPPSEGANLGTSILSTGLLIALVGLVLLITLAVTLLIETGTAVRRRGLPSAGGHGALAFVSGITRAVETFLAGAFVMGLVAAVVAVLAVEQLPGIVSAVLLVSGLLLPLVVLLHGVGALGGYLLGVGDSDGDGTATAE